MTTPAYFREFPPIDAAAKCSTCKTAIATKRWVIKPDYIDYPIAANVCDNCASATLVQYELIYGVKKT